MTKPATHPESQLPPKNIVGETTSTVPSEADLSKIEILASVTRLLVEHPLTKREDGTNPKNWGSKFPWTVLSLTSEDYDYRAGTGYRVSYSGVIDRATRDAMDRDPAVRITAGSDEAFVPVAERLPMIVDTERLRRMSPNALELAAKLANEILLSLEARPANSTHS